jgi:type I restriction enzyme, S subunit
MQITRSQNGIHSCHEKRMHRRSISMSSLIEPPRKQTRTYDRLNSVVFLKTGEPFGGLSNMAGGYPLLVHGVRIFSSEALYQACRFPHLPEVQRSIIAQASPMTAKMKSKPYRNESRPDWDRVRVKVMRWCLRVKLCQNWSKFSALLLQTGNRPIVEESRKDTFWGAKSVDDQTLVGMNVLGRLLMELREVIRSTNAPIVHVEPLDIPDFLLVDRQIEAIHGDYEAAEQSAPGSSRSRNTALGKEQRPLFEETSTSEGLPSQAKSVFAHDPQSIHFALYPVLKDSGVPWLGQVPAHWSVMPGQAVYKPRLLKNTGMRESTVLSLSYGRITVKSPDKLRGLVPESFETYQIVDPGNIIIRTTDLQNDQTSLRIGIAEHRGIITSAYMCLETTSLVSPQFGYQYLNACDLLKIMYGLGSGLRQNLDFSDIKRMPVLVPSPAEQAAIVRFVSYVDRQIQRYIRAKQKLIKLLQEQKQTVVNQAVTRGLDPNVRLKPSGIEWLGDVPEHWSIRPAKWFFREIDERSLNGDEELLSVSHLTGVTSRSEKSVTMFMAESYVGHKLCRPGDLVINTMWAWMAALGVSPQHGIVSPSYAVYRPYEDSCLLGDFADLLLRTKPYVSEFVCRSTGIRSSRLRLYPEQFLRIPILCPPAQEQETILKYVRSETGETERAVDSAMSQIGLLREYRTRLIADVVFGKLDVRNVAARLPDEPEKTEWLDDRDTKLSSEGELPDEIDEILEPIEA